MVKAFWASKDFWELMAEFNTDAYMSRGGQLPGHGGDLVPPRPCCSPARHQRGAQGYRGGHVNGGQGDSYQSGRRGPASGPTDDHYEHTWHLDRGDYSTNGYLGFFSFCFSFYFLFLYSYSDWSKLLFFLFVLDKVRPLFSSACCRNHFFIDLIFAVVKSLSQAI